jgi:hypothetical protein
MFSSISDSFTLITLQYVQIFLSAPVFFGVFLSIIAGNLVYKTLRILWFIFTCFVPLRNLRIFTTSLAYCYAVAYVWERNRLSKRYAGNPPAPSKLRVIDLIPQVWNKVDPALLKQFVEMSKMPRGIWVDVGAGTEIMTGFIPKVRGYKEFGLKVNQRNKLVL